jgi:putative hydrolase
MLKIDLHIHSVHSGHAYGTLYDIVAEAQRKEMAMIAITDHGPSMRGTAGPIHFGMGRRLPKRFGALRVLWGAEANIVGPRGELDIAASHQERLSFLLVNFHQNCGYVDRGVEGNTASIAEAFANPNVDAVAHVLHPQYPYDARKVIRAALEHDVLLELNTSYLALYGDRDVELYRYLVDAVRSERRKLLVGTDSHFLHEIGDDTAVRQFAGRLGLDDGLILNNYPEELTQALGLVD